MNNNPETEKIDDVFDVKEYVDVNSDAAVRTRWISIVLVIATVLIGIGFYNSVTTSWARYRYDSMYDNENISKINTSKDKYPVLDYFFGSEDFNREVETPENNSPKNLNTFVCLIWKDTHAAPETRTQSSTFPVSSYLYNSFNSKTKSLLERQCTEKNLTIDEYDVLKKSLFIDLNTVLKDYSFYDKNRFAGLNLSKVEEFLNSRKDDSGSIDLKPRDVIRRNRLVLETVYAGYILESRDIIPLEEDKNENVLSPDEKRRLQRQAETIRAYVDNVQWITIPVFGISIDVNDLGAVGGFSLFIIVLLLRFSLSREIKNLNVSFREAARHDKLSPFYHALAMRQVLTMPKMHGERRNIGLVAGSMIFAVMPLIVLSLGVSYDIYTAFGLRMYEADSVQATLLLGAFWVVLVSYFSLRCVERKLHIDQIWDDYYLIMRSREEYKVLISDYFQQSGHAKLREVVNYRLKNQPKPNKFWIYALISRIPWFIKTFFKNLFRQERYEVLFPFLRRFEPQVNFDAESESTNKELLEKKIKEFEKKRNLRNIFTMITVFSLFTTIFLLVFGKSERFYVFISEAIKSTKNVFKNTFLKLVSSPYSLQISLVITFISFTLVVVLILAMRKMKFNSNTDSESDERSNQDNKMDKT